jgi:hypothetical protein
MLERLKAAAGTNGAAAGLDPAAVRALLALSQEVVEQIVWEVVPDLAEEIIADVAGVRVRYSEEPGEGILRRVADREQARREKDWSLADRIRGPACRQTTANVFPGVASVECAMDRTMAAVNVHVDAIGVMGVDLNAVHVTSPEAVHW